MTTDSALSRRQLVQDLVRPDVFGVIDPVTLGRYGDARERAAARNLTLVISHERLSGYPAAGGYDRRLIADRLVTAFPDAKVLIVIREQVALIHSMYSQYISDGGSIALRPFLRGLEPQLGRMPYFRLSFYAFDALIAYYQMLFGANRVLVLAYETLAADPQAVADCLADFLGRPRMKLVTQGRVNTRRPVVMQEAARLANRWLGRTELSPNGLLPVPHLTTAFARLRPFFDVLVPLRFDERLSSKQRATIATHVGNHYAASNARTASLTGHDLAALGYPCTPAPAGQRR